ncbi:RND transporter, partial [Burkholderia multivorans]
MDNMHNTNGLMRIAKVAAASTLLATLLAACAVGPDYKRPDVTTPAAFKEAPTLAPGEQAGTWKPAEPADGAHRGEWWKVFGDPVLDALEEQALAANQNLKAAAARV